MNNTQPCKTKEWICSLLPCLHLPSSLRKCRTSSPLSKFCRSSRSATRNSRERNSSPECAGESHTAAAVTVVAPLGNFPLAAAAFLPGRTSRSFPPTLIPITWPKANGATAENVLIPVVDFDPFNSLRVRNLLSKHVMLCSNQTENTKS